MKTSRRKFIMQAGAATASIPFIPIFPSFISASKKMEKFTFEISLAEFSFASELYTGKMTNLDFPERAKKVHGINTLEYVSGFFNEKHTDENYLKELKLRCDDLGMKNHLIMVDGGNIASINSEERQKAVEQHHPWVDAAKYLGCSYIRVNLGDVNAAMTGQKEPGTPEEILEAAIQGYGELLDYAQKEGINVLVENHFGISTNPDWLVKVMQGLSQENKGFLPDFGNFCSERSQAASSEIKDLLSTECLHEYDKYDGVKKMMPYTKAISAKTYLFDESGDAQKTDFYKMFKIIKDSGWSGGYVGIEYEGGVMRDLAGKSGYLSNDEGVQATKLLLEKVRTALS